jgi:spermidine/putrescine transport system permease protein
MAERGFEISRLPGFATVAVAAFVILYLPIVTLVICPRYQTDPRIATDQ